MPAASRLLPALTSLGLSLWLSGQPTSARAAEPPTTPFLRIQAGMHTAMINRISTDAGGRVALTCSSDKTARLWSLPEGRLLRTFRPPLSQGNEGRLDSCALSPDGSLAAVSGWTGYAWDESNCIYLFDTATGRLLRRLEGMPDVICELAFSAQGRYLASGLGGARGIRIWEVATGRLAGEDDGYEGACYGMDWRGEDSLATTSYDGALRLYLGLDKALRSGGTEVVTLKPARRVTSNSGKLPFGIRFSPDGRNVAVGFNDSQVVLVLSGTDLSLKYKPDTRGVEQGDLGSVAWSTDGLSLIAGGGWDVNRKKPVRLWSEAGLGKSHDVLITPNTLMDFRALPEGGFLVGSSDPAWGVLKETGNARSNGASFELLGRNPVPDYRAGRENFRISADASVVSFGFSEFGKDPAQFALDERVLAVGPGSGLLRAPRQEGLGVTDWKNSTSVKLGGKPIPLKSYEVSRSFAVAPDESFFVLGADWTLRLFEADGRLRWAVSGPEACWAVNISADGRVIVSAYGDGTIRWHRADTGRELLVFFPHADRKRWVLWAPQYEPRPYGRLGAQLSEKTKGAYGGVVVETVLDGSAAQAAGLRAGDEIVTVNGVRLSRVDQTVEMIKKMTPGTALDVSYVRGGKRYGVDAKVGESTETYLVPAGAFYDCSPEGESLIGWHVNRGKDQEADFFPASKFRDQFYRPDIVARVLDTLDVAEALKQANEVAGRRTITQSAEELISQMQPPVVELLVGGVAGQAEVSGSRVELRYRVRQGGQYPVTRVRVLVDGRPLPTELPIPAGENAVAVAGIPAPERDAVLTLLAENRFAVSQPATLRLVRKMEDAASLAQGSMVPDALKPKLYVLSAGISDYLNEDHLPDLNYAAKDAEDIAAAFKRQEGGLYQKVEVRVLTNQAATAADLEDGLEWLKSQVTAKDIAVVFFSGHGENDEELRYHFCPHDYNPARRLRTGLPAETFVDIIRKLPGKVVFFVDSCHAGNALGKLARVRTKGAGNDVGLTRAVNALTSAETGAIVLLSSTARQLSQESELWENGAFTKAIVEGLDGKADLLGKGSITVTSLETYVAERVKELTNNAQTPTSSRPETVPDFPIAIKK